MEWGTCYSPRARGSSHEVLSCPMQSTGVFPRQGYLPWPSAVLHELPWPFQQLLLEATCMLMHISFLVQAYLTTEKFSCLLPPSAPFVGRSGLYQGESNYLNSGQVGRPQAGEGADVLVCFSQHRQAATATLMLPRNIQTFGLGHLITTSSKVARTSHTWVSASCGLSEAQRAKRRKSVMDF